MSTKDSLRRYRYWYGKLIRLYPKSYRERFGEGMEQTFNDLCRERVNGNLLGFVFWMFVETFLAIIRENLLMNHKSLIRIFIVVGSILMAPLIGVLFFGWNWDWFDFLVIGVVLFCAAFAYEWVAAKGGTIWYRTAVALALFAGVVLLWVNGAVGIIGTKNNLSNPMYFGVLMIGAISAIIGRFKPQGMARALCVTALAQALVPIIALMIWNPRLHSWSPGVPGVFLLHAFFVMLFLGSALLFRRASATVVQGDKKV